MFLLGLLLLADSAPETTEQRLDRLERDNGVMREQLEALTDQLEFAEERLATSLAQSGKLSGYLDFGFFWVEGDGSGLRTDIGHEHLPKYQDVPDSWVFLGDPLATAVNARGEPADTSESRAVTFDSVNAGSNPSFLVNAVNLALFAGLSPELQVNALVDFVPRGRNVSDSRGTFLGDFLDVKLAYAEYRIAGESGAMSLFAGKIDSTLGREYRGQESPDRLAVTPSLICRYTCGRPLGLKARAVAFEDTLNIALAITNGSNVGDVPLLRRRGRKPRENGVRAARGEAARH